MIPLAEIKTANVGGRWLGICPSCMAEVPSLEVTRGNDNFHGFCGRCGLDITETVPSLSTNTNSYRENGDKLDDKSGPIFTDGRRTQDLFAIGTSLIKGGMAKELIRQALDFLAQSCHPPFSPEEAEDKIKEILQRAEKSERGLAIEVDEWLVSSKGSFMSSTVAKDLHVSSREGKKNLSKILSRRCQDGMIERHGEQNGCFRRIDRDIERMNFLDASTEAVNLTLPFEIHKKVEILPGNVILIAGEVNSGKSCFCLNLIKSNMAKFDIHYFNSEMAAGELRKRLLKFEDPPLEKWRFSAYERSNNFADVMVGGKGKINIIDFLELHENFYEIGARIAEVHRKLNGGIGVIAIQKNKGVDTGLGGYRSLEKPRLALAMSPGVLKIVKAKNWCSSENPNGLVTEFNIFAGAKLEQKGFWHREVQ